MLELSQENFSHAYGNNGNILKEGFDGHEKMHIIWTFYNGNGFIVLSLRMSSAQD